MSEYQEHMNKIASMEGWSHVDAAPMYQPVNVMDHAGNQLQAVRKRGGWEIFSIYNPLMHGQTIRPIKWKV